MPVVWVIRTRTHAAEVARIRPRSGMKLHGRHIQTLQDCKGQYQHGRDIRHLRSRTIWSCSATM